GFTPASSPSDAPASGSGHGSDAGVGLDAHAFLDAHEFLDAPVTTFDPAMCPTGYSNNTITASPNSRYKILTGMATLKMQSDACNADHAGWTHLIVLDTVQEAQQINSHMGGNFYYVGAVQPANQASPSAGWLQLTGAAVPNALWQAGQPNDNGGGAETNAQNFAAVDDSSGLMNDVNGAFQYQAVCECDGLPISAAALSALNQ
ncbi:MAG TPA: hypothetical protein VIV58_21115, partial [Kofleriaceae bacterium]